MQHYQTQQRANTYTTLPDGTRRYSRYEVGVIDGRYRAMPVLVADKAGFDGLGFDASVGSGDDHYTVLNLFDGSHKYIDSVAVVGADDDDHAAHLALSQFDYLGADYATVVVNDSAQYDDISLDALGQDGWSSEAIARLMNHPSQDTGYYLPIINSKMLRTEQNRVTADNVMWDGANLVSHGSDYSRLLLDLQKHDAFGGLTAKFDMRELLADLGATELGFDALMETYSRLDAMGDRLFTALGRHAVGDLTVTNVTTTKPFKRQGVANVAMQFDLSDGQTFSIIFHNPDADPKKLAANDTMVSWKWLLNKKDVTAAVSPKQSDKVRYDVIASRIMKVAAKNSKRFVAAQMKKAQNQEKIAEAQKAVDDKQAYLEQLDKDIAELKQQIDDFRLSDEARIKAGNTLQDKHARIVGGINIDPIIERMKKDDVFHDSTAVEWFNDSLAKYDMSHNYSDLPSELRGALRIINAIANGDTRDVYYIVDSINVNFAKKLYRAAVAEHFNLPLTINSSNNLWQKAIAELYAAKGVTKEQFEQAFMLGQTQHKQAVEAEQAARREQEAQRQAEIDASEAQYQTQKAAEEQYIRDWLPNADAKTIGRIKKVLETNVQYTSGWFNGVATRKQFIETVIQAGGQPKTEMRRKWIPAKGDSLGDTRPYEPARWSETKVYVLEDDTGTTSIDISKTEYDYAVYLLQKASAPQAGHSTEMVKLDLTAANPLDEQQVINEYATDNNAFDGDYIDTFKDDRDIFNAIDKAQNALAEKGYPAWAIATANGDYVAVYILPDGKFSSSDMRESAESAYQNMLTSRENQIKSPDGHNAKVLADNENVAEPTAEPQLTAQTSELSPEEAKLQKMLDEQAFMKEVNKIVKSKKSDDEVVALLVEKYGISQNIAKQFATDRDYKGNRKGFQVFQLTNLNNRIKTQKAKVDAMKKLDEINNSLGGEDMVLAGVTIYLNKDANRVQLDFPSKPSRDIINILKKNGWKWSPSNQVWQRQLTEQAMNNARKMIEAYADDEGIDMEEDNTPSSEPTTAPAIEETTTPNPTVATVTEDTNVSEQTPSQEQQDTDYLNSVIDGSIGLSVENMKQVIGEIKRIAKAGKVDETLLNQAIDVYQKFALSIKVA